MHDPLLPHDFDTNTWDRLKQFLDRRLAQHRERNDAPLDPLDTATTRGHISEIKFLLTLDIPAPAMEASVRPDD